MKPIVKYILAIIAGWLVGGIVNMSLVKLGNIVFPMEGVDTNNLEELAAAMPTLSFQYFIFPFLAHALGTLAGALIAALIAPKNKMRSALVIGIIFLAGGIAASMMLPAPTWFIVADLALAYIPMAWIGGKIGCGKSSAV